MITMQGFLILLGTVVNNPIMMSTTTTIFPLSPLVLILLTHKMLILATFRVFNYPLYLRTCGVRFVEK
jgi:hypothetical protein